MRSKEIDKAEVDKAIEKIISSYDDNTGYYDANASDWCTVSRYISDLERKLRISDAYNVQMYFVLTDSVGTKINSISDMVGLIDYARDLVVKQGNKDDKSPIFFDGLGKKYNILHEEVMKDEK